MAGKRGRKKFELYRDARFGVDVQIYVGTASENHGHYLAHYGGRTISKASLAELKKELREAIETLNQLDWRPVIAVNAGEQFERANSAGKIHLKYKRHYIAQKPNGEWVRVSWDVEAEHRTTNMGRFSFGNQRSNHNFDQLPIIEQSRWMGDDSFALLEYDEQLWNALEWISGQIDQLREMIQTAVFTGPGRARLIENAQKALPLSTANKIDE